MRKTVTSTFVGAQGTQKAVQDFLKSIPTGKGEPRDAEDFLTDFNKKFIGLDD